MKFSKKSCLKLGVFSLFMSQCLPKPRLLSRGGRIVLLIFLFLIGAFVVFSSSPSQAILQTYGLGQPVKLSLDGKIGCELKITTPSTSFVYSIAQEDLAFRPQETGVYTGFVRCEDSEEFFSFEVVDSNLSTAREERELVVLRISEGIMPEDEATEVRVGKPVRFTKEVLFGKDIRRVRISLPAAGFNISVYEKNFANRINLSFIATNLSSDETSLILKDVSGYVEVEYFMPAPIQRETKIAANKKRVVVSSEFHYENVSASTSISEITNDSSRIRVYWAEGAQFVPFSTFDLDGNGLIDEVEWIVPHLSNQTFEIIFISKAELLDSDRLFLEDIYDFVKNKDDVWKTISGNHYVRINFERSLSDRNDISIYARSNSSSRIEVYEKDSFDKIADFGLIADEDWYKVYLSNLSSESDSFDLKIIGGSVDIDYLVDPSFVFTYDYWGVTQAAGPHDAYNVDLDAWPPADGLGSIRGNTNSYTELSNSEYRAINRSDNSREQVPDPGSGDEPMLWLRMQINEPASKVTQMKFLFEGYPGDDGNIYIYLFNVTANAWRTTALASAAFGTSDQVLVGTLNGGFSDIINSSGSVRWGVYSSSSSENLNVDFVQMNVSATDNEAPRINIVSPLNQNYTSATIHFNVTLNDEGSWCGFSLDGAANVTMNRFNDTYFSYINSTMTQGMHSVVFSCNDTFTNMNSSSGARYFGVDTIFPEVTIISPLNRSYNDAAIQFNFSLDEPGYCVYSLNGGGRNYTMTANASLTGFNATNSSISEGSYSVRAYCNDTAGNWNRTVQQQFRIDRTAPTVNIVSPLNQTYNTSVISFNATVNENASWCGFSLDGAANVTMTRFNNTYFNYTDSLVDGSYFVAFSCNDTGGNMNSTPKRYFGIDTVLPVIDLEIISPLGNINVPKYDFFNVTINVSCSVKNCGIVNVSLDPPINWSNSSFRYRKEISIVNSGSDLSNFPIYLNVAREAAMQADYDDLRFYNASCTSDAGKLMDFEIENFTGVRAVVWLRAPKFSSGENEICMYYGNSSVTSGQNRGGVWDSYFESVYHLSETSGTVIRDSTSASNNGASAFTPAGNINAPGIADGGDYYNGDEMTTPGKWNADDTNGAPHTYCAWVNFSVLRDETILEDGGNTNGDGIGIDSSGRFIYAARNGGASYVVRSTGSLADSRWHHLCAVYNTSGAASVYVDGALDNFSVQGTGAVGTDGAGIGGGNNQNPVFADSNPHYFNGTLDEITISNYQRSSDWINMSYQLIANQERLLNFGPEEIQFKGLIPTAVGSVPFYTNASNPRNISLNAGQSRVVVFWVNATGTIGSTYEFFAYANLSSNRGISDLTNRWNVTIGNPREAIVPIINITFPTSSLYLFNVSELNYTYSDLNPGFCWFSNSSGAWNSTPVSAGINFTGISTFEGANTFTLYCNDSFGNSNRTNVTFMKDTEGQVLNVTINSPMGAINDVTPTLNVTLEGMAYTLWYSLFNGSSWSANITLCNLCSGEQTKFMYVKEGNFSVQVYANNSVGSFFSNESDFLVDMNFSYYDSFDDNSSIISYNNVSWLGGNVTFFGPGPRTYNGIQFGYVRGNLNFVANQWNGGSNAGEVDITCPGGDAACSFISQNNTNISTPTINSGVALTDGLSIQGFIMYSATDVHTRFSAAPPQAANSNHFIGVCYTGGQWYWDDNNDCSNGPFVPLSTDILVANVTWGVSSISALNTSSFIYSQGNFTSYPINTTQQIKRIVNATWQEYNTDGNNTISMEVSLNGGNNWHRLNKNQELLDVVAGHSLVYRVLFNSTQKNISLLDVNITWSGSTPAPPNISIISPVSAVKDVTPILNLSIDASAKEVWYTTNNGRNNYTMCRDCGAGIYSSFLYLAEGNFTVLVYANNSLGEKSSASSNFIVDMNFSYFDSFEDSSSLGSSTSGVSWAQGNFSFSGSSVSELSQDIQSGPATIQVGDIGTDVSILEIDPASSFLIFNYRVNDVDPGDTLVYGNITSPTNIHFETNANQGENNPVYIQWYVASFSSGVNVQRGVITQSAVSVNTTISPVNTSSTFPLISYEDDGTGFGATDFVRGRLVNESTLQTYSVTASNDLVAWQTVDYTGALVQNGSLSMSAATQTISLPRNVNRNKAFVIATWAVSGGMQADDAGLLVNFQSDSQLYFERKSSTGTLHISWYVVEFTQGETVRSGVASFAVGDTIKDIPIIKVDKTKSIAFLSGNQKGGSSTYAASGNMGVTWFTAEITNDTNLRLRRELAVGPADVQWYVVEFGSTTNGIFNSYPINTTSDIVEISNIDWQESGTGEGNEIEVEISVDGDSWYPAINGQGLYDFVPGDSLIYRVLFSASGTGTVSLLDMTINWTNVTAGPPSVVINSPQHGSTIADVTPTLNVTIGGIASHVWYSMNRGKTNITLCTSCSGEKTAFLYYNESPQSVDVYANNRVGETTHETSNFTVDMNFSYFDSFEDNSSVLASNGVEWFSGNLSYVSHAGAEIKRVQRSSAVIPVGTTSIDVAIDPVDMGSSFLVFSYTSSDTDPSDYLVYGNLTDPNNIRFGTSTAQTENTMISIEWYVVEFYSGVDVQRGTIVQERTTDTIINPVNLSNSFPLISYQDDGQTFGGTDSVRARLTSSNDLETYVVTSPMDTLSWQVVSYNGALVQHDVFSLTEVSDSITLNRAIDPDRSFVIATWAVSGNSQPDDAALLVNITDSSTIYFERNSATGTMHVSWYVVEFTGGELVQTGTATFANAERQKNITFSQPINETTSVAFLTGNQKGGSSSYGADDIFGHAWFTAKIVNSTTLQLMRNSTGNSNARVQWYVIDFSPPALANFTAYSINTSSNIAEILNVSWQTAGEDENNTIEVQYSPNYGANWYDAVNGQGNSQIQKGNKLLYRVLFNSKTPGRTLSLLDMTINWTNTTMLPPQIIINSPTNTSSIADVTPTLNVTLNGLAKRLWYTADNGKNNITLCTYCSGTQSAFMYLAEGVYTAKVYSSNNLDETASNSTTFTVDLRRNYYDTFDDNSSIIYIGNATWYPGNVSYVGNSLGEFRIYTANLTQPIAQLSNITWSSVGTDANNIIRINVSFDGGTTWYNVSNGGGLSGFPAGSRLMYKAFFRGQIGRSMSLLDINITWQAPPRVNITFPLSAIYNYTITRMNYTVSTSFGLTNCWYTINGGAVNTSATCGQNITGLSAPEGNSTWVVYANDTNGAIGSSSVYFIVDLTLPNITFINQTDEDGLFVNGTHPIDAGQNLSIYVNISDTNLGGTPWIIVWESVKGGVQKVRQSLTWLGGILYVAIIQTSNTWNTYYQYTIYANDTAGHIRELDNNFTILKLNATLLLVPNLTNGSGTVSVWGHINFSNGTDLADRPINLWLGNQLLWLDDLTGTGTYDYTRLFNDTSGSDFDQGVYNQTTNNGASITLSGGNTSGSFSRVLDAGARVDWENIVWQYTGAACSASVSYQQGNAVGYGSAGDTYISSGASTTNYGTSDFLSIDTSPSNDRGILRFDDILGFGGNKVPYDSTILQANITAYVYDTGDQVSVYEILEDWNDLQATYNNRLTSSAWSSSGCAAYPSRSNTLESSFTPSSNGAYTFNVTNALRRWTNRTSDNYGIVLHAGGSNNVLIRSSEYDTSSQRPRLNVRFSSSDCVSATFYYRTSNDKVTWSSWKQAVNGDSINDSLNKSRYLEYRINLTSFNSTLKPYVGEVSVNYTAVVTEVGSGDFNFSFNSPETMGTFSVCLNSSYRTIFSGACAVLKVVPPQAPVISLVSPGNNSWNATGNLILVYNASDANDNIVNSTLFINGQYNQTNSSVILNARYNNFTINLTESGQYNWTVLVADGDNNVRNASRTFYVDLEDPNVNLLWPYESSVQSDVILNLSYSVTDNLDPNLTCSIVLDSSTIYSGVNSPNGSIVNRSTPVLGAGFHYWNVTCVDNANRRQTSPTWNFSIGDTPPTVNLVWPAPSYLDDDGDISFVFNATDDFGFINCTLIINDVFDTLNQSEINNGGETIITRDNFGEGLQNWTVRCYDTAEKYSQPPARIFRVDKYYPTIQLLAPGDELETDSSDVRFNFNVTDSFDSSLTCNLTINGFDVQYGFSANSGENTSRLVQDLTDGIQLWNVTCFDDAGHVNTSDTWSINISEPPVVILNTSNDSSFNEGSFSLQYNATDNGQLTECQLYIDGNYNQSNSSEIFSGQISSFDITNQPDGVHTWFVRCFDSVSAQGQSVTYSFSVDGTPPSVTLWYPDGHDVYSANITFNFTVVDLVDPMMNCSLSIDGVVNITSIAAQNGSVTNRTVSGLKDGNHTWFVNCTDDAGNSDGSLIYNFTRLTEPRVTLLWPPNGYWFNSQVFNLSYLPEEDQGLISSSLIINGFVNATNSTAIVLNQPNNFTVANFPDGRYNWTVNATDLTGLNGTAPGNYFFVDTHAPSLILNAPDGLTLVTTNNVSFNFTVTDSLAEYLMCNLTLDGDVDFSGQVQSGIEKIRYSLVSDGAHTWNVTCWDNATNYNRSRTITFNVEAPPNVTLDKPNNGSWIGNRNVTFFYTPIDPIGITGCNLYVNGVFNQSAVPAPNIQSNFTVRGLSEGTHLWTVNCTDADVNTFAPQPYTVYIDVTPPNVNIVSPFNGSNTLRRVMFNFSATDNLDNETVCIFFVDGGVNQSNIVLLNGSSVVVNVSGLSLGQHSWNVSCRDEAANNGSSLVYGFNVTLLDLLVNSTSFVLNVSMPIENESILLNATVHNLINLTAENVIVQFFVGNYSSYGGRQIGSNQTISLLNGLASASINVTWNAELGNTVLFVVVDPPIISNGSIEEWDEGNNVASHGVSVGSWEYVYGSLDAGSEFRLEDQNASSVIRWSSLNVTQGNLYVADSESSILWTNLTALGRDKTGNVAANDFSDIDTLLNMTGYPDSVSALYASGGNPLNTTNLSVFNRVVSFVPIANSTNTSSFFTGILWDPKNDTDGQFSIANRETLIFVATINKQQVGAYGTYDYEIRIPARLREYYGPDKSKVFFYTEIL